MAIVRSAISAWSSRSWDSMSRRERAKRPRSSFSNWVWWSTANWLAISRLMRFVDSMSRSCAAKVSPKRAHGECSVSVGLIAYFRFVRLALITAWISLASTSQSLGSWIIFFSALPSLNFGAKAFCTSWSHGAIAMCLLEADTAKM